MKKASRLLALSALLASLGLGFVITTQGAQAQDQTLLHVSYDPTRELYDEFNAAFAAHWKETTGGNVTVEQSHGGSGKQAQSVIDGLGADVVSLALEGDINAIAERSGLIAADWRARFENNSTPYTSTIVFLVREGNPKAILDWGDLIKDGVEVITPNPKTSGGARWNYLAAWHWAITAYGDEAQAIEFIRTLYTHAPVLDTGARGSTVTFVQKELGDVLLAWENEAYLVLDEFGADSFDIVHPPTSILAEPPVALVDKNAEAHGTTALATAYLEYLYSAEGQSIAARNHYRPSKPDLVEDKSLLEGFPQIELISIDDPLFGGWATAQPKHFGDGGIFDQIYAQ